MSEAGPAAGRGAVTEPARIDVAGERPYPVWVGRGVRDRLASVVTDLGATRALVVHQPPLVDAAEAARAQLEAAGVDAHRGEVCGQAGLTRSDVVVGLGGGAVTDLAGFVAATWMRGVRVVHVPTTLLAMVDAAVGGKTGINTAAGKNLVGAFHEPSAVLVDLSLLESLPREELVAGLGEVVKCGFIADPAILDLVERTDPAALTAGSAELRELVERAIRVKVDVVVGDLREAGGADGHPGREVLNYGHTLAHAIERTSDYTVH